MLLLIDAPYNKNTKESKNIIRFGDVNYAIRALLHQKTNITPLN